MNILLIDDHAIVRAGLRRLLTMSSAADIREAGNGREGLGLARAQRPDLVITDLNLPELGGVELVTRLRRMGTMPILVLSMHTEPFYVRQALAAGAQGYVSKSATPDEMLVAVRRLSGGGRYVEQEIAQAMAVEAASPVATLAQLAPRELEILRQLASGRSLAEIADALGLGYKTIANNCSQIKARLGVTRTADLLRLTLEAGLNRP